MIIKKEGIINKIVYDNTVYHNGEYRIYPPIIDLKGLIREIIKSKATTKYIRFNPFYINAKINRQIEFDEYMFYFECRDHINDEDYKKHIESCFGKQYVDMSNEEINTCKILFPLCEYKDIGTYKKSLEAYVEFLNELIPKLMEIAKNKMELKNEDLGFGYFCFEVDSE